MLVFVVGKVVVMIVDYCIVVGDMVFDEIIGRSCVCGFNYIVGCCIFVVDVDIF